MIRGRLLRHCERTPLASGIADEWRTLDQFEPNEIEFSFPVHLEYVEDQGARFSHLTVRARLADHAADSERHILLTVHRSEDVIVVSVGEWCQIPIFVRWDDREVYFSWRFTDLLVPIGTHTLDSVSVSRFLSGTQAYGARTLIQEVLLLPERSTLVAGSRDVVIQGPSHAKSFVQREPKKGVDLSVPLEARLARVVRTWTLPDTDALFELSGGYDSSTIAVAAKSVVPSAKAYGIAFPGVAGANQRARRRAVWGKEQSDVCLDVGDVSFLGRWFDLNEPLDPTEEIYRDLTVHVLNHTAFAAGSRVFTGIGGDELGLPLLGHRSSAERVDAREHPKSRIPESALLAAYSRTGMFLERGIWPVNPYLEPPVLEFLERVPDRFKSQRLLQKQLLRRLGMPDEIIARPLPENFGDLMRAELARVAPNIREITHPLLVEDGYIAASRWRRIMDADWFGCSRDEINSSVRILNLELFAQRVARVAHE